LLSEAKSEVNGNKKIAEENEKFKYLHSLFSKYTRIEESRLRIPSHKTHYNAIIFIPIKEQNVIIKNI